MTLSMVKKLFKMQDLQIHGYTKKKHPIRSIKEKIHIKKSKAGKKSMKPNQAKSN